MSFIDIKGKNVSEIIKNITGENVNIQDTQNECIKDLEEINLRVKDLKNKKKSLLNEHENLLLEKNSKLSELQS